jgi:hypothetical protein
MVSGTPASDVSVESMRYVGTADRHCGRSGAERHRAGGDGAGRARRGLREDIALRAVRRA